MENLEWIRVFVESARSFRQLRSFFFYLTEVNHLSQPCPPFLPDSTYFLEIVNKTRRFTVSAILHRRRRWSYGNETLISHALQSAALCIILAAAAGLPLSLFLRRFLPRHRILPSREYPR